MATLHRACGQPHRPLTFCPEVLAQTADVLAKASRNLGSKVDGSVDRILGDVARRAALDLDDLAAALRELEQ